MALHFNILVFPGGTENGLEIKRSLEHCKEFSVYSASSDQPNHAPFAYENNAYIPSIFEDGWIDRLNQVVREFSIDYIFPSNSAVISALNGVRDLISCKLIMACNEAILNTESKKRTNQLLSDVIAIPKQFESGELIDEWPVFLKPDKGYGAQGAKAIHNMQELTAALSNNSDMLVQEFLPGKEYTVDCFSSADGRLIFSGARSRDRVRMGTSMRSTLTDNSFQSRMAEIAENIQKRIPLTGPWFFQVKEDRTGTLKLLEVDARVAGTMALNRVNGVNFPALSVFSFAGLEVDVLPQRLADQIDRCLQNRYSLNFEFDHVYIDLDHTIILSEKVNTQIVTFLYQCLNKGKRITLLTKSLEDDLVAYLERFRIYQIFDEILWIKEQEKKSDYIKSDSCLFIDDSFSQRAEVYQIHQIPCLDPSMIELLIHDRI